MVLDRLGLARPDGDDERAGPARPERPISRRATGRRANSVSEADGRRAVGLAHVDGALRAFGHAALGEEQVPSVARRGPAVRRSPSQVRSTSCEAPGGRPSSSPASRRCAEGRVPSGAMSWTMSSAEPGPRRAAARQRDRVQLDDAETRIPLARRRTRFRPCRVPGERRRRNPSLRRGSVAFRPDPRLPSRRGSRPALDKGDLPAVRGEPDAIDAGGRRTWARGPSRQEIRAARRERPRGPLRPGPVRHAPARTAGRTLALRRARGARPPPARLRRGRRPARAWSRIASLPRRNRAEVALGRGSAVDSVLSRRVVKRWRGCPCQAAA